MLAGLRRFGRFIALLAVVGVGGCSASGPETAFETAYSAMGSQVKNRILGLLDRHYAIDDS
jgi:hypothetical protein